MQYRLGKDIAVKDNVAEEDQMEYYLGRSTLRNR